MKPLFTEADCDLSHFLESSQRASMSVAKANRLFQEWLAKGTVFYGMELQHKDCWGPYVRKNDTHKALLINIEPIEVPDSADKIVSDIAKYLTHPHNAFLSDILERARKLTQNKGGGK